MSLTPEAVEAKFASLNDTQDSITGIAHWVMFHKRYANEIVQIWLQTLHEASGNKKLLLLYLLNEVVQQSRVKKRTEYIDAVAPFVVASVSSAYHSVPSATKTKIKYVYDIWCQRNIFSKDILNEMNKSFSNANATYGQSFGPMGPLDWSPVAEMLIQTKIFGKSASTTKTAVDALWGSLTQDGASVTSASKERRAQLETAIRACQEEHKKSIEARNSFIEALNSIILDQKTLTEQEDASVRELDEKLACLTGASSGNAVGATSGDDMAAATATAPTATVPETLQTQQSPSVSHQEPEELTEPGAKSASFTPPIANDVLSSLDNLDPSIRALLENGSLNPSI
ncbi:RNA polymerase II transcription termination factor [Schizosaccharomyces japonicus yFS275]|uniref:RNA polymerase II transcription termination factor n=1 Tax=Schizosaccharomyces japonicus (strain yFS275 / FY16936) TaxID=402676 RepID=B6JVN3_SCHJY|nr:RNA polymerase II transcription termination factor [Schizosaccharomyces japonicus yFS275]EEB05434.1 RNA polymerase II transcription termination factor [Schizosaccharomyces japonicus yFS275]